MPRTCLVLMDGVRYDTAVRECGYLQAAVEAGQAHRWRMQTCLPTISAAMYETIHTGLSPIEHGILGNEGIRASRSANVFSVLREAGRVTGAVAHSYFHTLDGDCAFDPFEHIEVNDKAASVPTLATIQWRGIVRQTHAFRQKLTSAHKPGALPGTTIRIICCFIPQAAARWGTGTQSTPRNIGRKRGRSTMRYRD